MNRITLIIDAGGTSTDFALVKYSGNKTVVLSEGKGVGINAALMSSDEIEVILSDILNGKVMETPDEVCFYGAGCAGKRQIERVEAALRKIDTLKERSLVILNDLTGAARALLKDEEGVACILGTGSATGLFRKGQLIDSIPSLGYILGDEGSGATIGKMILSRIFKRMWSEELRCLFMDEYHFDYAEIIERVYRTPAPNAFLGSLVPFAYKYKMLPEMREMLREVFELFIKTNLDYYRRPGKILNVGFSGGIAYAFSEVLTEVCSECSVEIKKIVSSPMEGLIEYHKLKWEN